MKSLSSTVFEIGPGIARLFGEGAHFLFYLPGLVLLVLVVIGAFAGASMESGMLALLSVVVPIVALAYLTLSSGLSFFT